MDWDPTLRQKLRAAAAARYQGNNVRTKQIRIYFLRTLSQHPTSCSSETPKAKGKFKVFMLFFLMYFIQLLTEWMQTSIIYNILRYRSPQLNYMLSHVCFIY